MRLSDLFRKGHPFRLLLLSVLHLSSLLRIAVLFVIEFLLALIDCLRGLIAGQDLWKEIKFVPSRVGVCVLMRELATIGAKMDATRGLPVVYLDLVGYDEQSHRRGPTSRFAHWSLKGIDDAIARIWKAAHRSGRRDYDVWIFSDHGSEDVWSYVRENGRTVREAVAQVFDQLAAGGAPEEHDDQARVIAGAPSYLSWRSPRQHSHLNSHNSDRGPAASRKVIVTAMGPVGHVYVNRSMERFEYARFAQALVTQAQIPMVLAAAGPDKAHVWTREGQFVLPEQAASVLAPDHPFLTEVATDLVALCHQSNAGDLVLSGWRRNGPRYSFPSENGAHAGPGLEETHAFALMPVDAPLSHRAEGYLRPTCLRQAALRHLGQEAGPIRVAPALVSPRNKLRLMTYNVHTCRGLDGKLSPHRIARVIARYQPDVVALQEVDVGRARTNHTDQARVIAECLEMEYHFHPAMRLEEEAYGDCILSRLPIRLVKAGPLPTLTGWSLPEPRGALWVRVELGSAMIELINTHLGLRSREQSLQIQALLGADWIGNNGRSHPVVLCGDFNATPRSAVWRLCTRRLRDVQVEAAVRKPRCTWFGRYPIARIDHVFVSSQVHVVHVDVGDDHLACIASDHRPLFTELQIHSQLDAHESPCPCSRHTSAPKPAFRETK
jgi:endonuclease/exonuclease/phosphatase family metal-dependent hydrolase